MLSLDLSMHLAPLFRAYGTISVPPNKLIFDPSVLYTLMHHELKKGNFEIYTPDRLLDIIDLSRKNDKYKAFLRRFLCYFSYRGVASIEEHHWEMLYRNIERVPIRRITDENIEVQEYNTIRSMFEKHSFYISMSPKVNFLGEIVAKIICFSKKTSIAILSKTRRLLSLVRERIVALELPRKLDDIVLRKQKVTGQLFDFHGGKATKFFVGVVLSVTSYFSPIIGVPGMLFVLMDP